MRNRDLVILAGAILLALVMTVVIFRGAVLETGSWGLSFQQEIPQGPASGQDLARFDAAYLGDTREKVLYLTFDAGYENGHTEKILDILQNQDVKAAFFLVGNYIEKNADLVRRMVEEGHIVGNHTLHHPDMTKLSQEEFRRELEGLAQLFQTATGKEMPKFYRPPQGIYSEENLQTAKQMGYHTVFWSLAYADWDNENQPSREDALEKLTGRIHNGAVILLHLNSSTNAEILEELLTKYKEMGYTFQTIDALF